ncbi:MAG TPA: glycosyltransferase [Candidatus Acidoferrum sp.]
MLENAAYYGVFVLAATPFVYYVLALYASWRFFRRARQNTPRITTFSPPVSNLKPVRGLDPDAYENFASYCRQDYPQYELLFCVHDQDDPAVAILEKLAADFPHVDIRILYGSEREAINDKVAKLGRLVAEAKYDVLVINDADVRVRPDYLRTVVAPLANPRVGGVTCLYVSIEETNFVQHLQSIGMISDFYPGLLVAWQLDGVKFALGQTMVTTRARIAGFGGYQAIENRPADDLLLGRLVSEQGYEMQLLPYAVETVADFQSPVDLLHKRLRWMTVMRHMRPWGHIGLLFTFGLPWAILAAVHAPQAWVAIAYLGGYAFCRAATAWEIGIWGLKQSGIWTKMLLIPLWDAFAFLIWLASFTRSTIRWRGIDYLIREGRFVPVAPPHATPEAERT